MYSYAFNLLEQSESLMLEIDGQRSSAVMVRCAPRRGIVVRIQQPEYVGQLTAGTALQLQLPDEHHLWVFPTEVVRPLEQDPASYLLVWPTRVDRVERRAAPRLQTLLPVRVALPARPAVASYLVDVSSTGLRFAFPEHLQPGSVVSVRFWIPPDTLVACAAQIAWSRELCAMGDDRMYMIGAAFQSLSLEADNHLSYFVRAELARRRTPQPATPARPVRGGLTGAL
jgi:hypothetical protein